MLHTNNRQKHEYKGRRRLKECKKRELSQNSPSKGGREGTRETEIGRESKAEAILWIRFALTTERFPSSVASTVNGKRLHQPTSGRFWIYHWHDWNSPAGKRNWKRITLHTPPDVKTQLSWMIFNIPNNKWQQSFRQNPKKTPKENIWRPWCLEGKFSTVSA